MTKMPANSVFQQATPAAILFVVLVATVWLSEEEVDSVLSWINGRVMASRTYTPAARRPRVKLIAERFVVKPSWPSLMPLSR